MKKNKFTFPIVTIAIALILGAFTFLYGGKSKVATTDNAISNNPIKVVKTVETAKPTIEPTPETKAQVESKDVKPVTQTESKDAKPSASAETNKPIVAKNQTTKKVTQAKTIKPKTVSKPKTPKATPKRTQRKVNAPRKTYKTNPKPKNNTDGVHFVQDGDTSNLNLVSKSGYRKAQRIINNAQGVIKYNNYRGNPYYAAHNYTRAGRKIQSLKPGQIVNLNGKYKVRDIEYHNRRSNTINQGEVTANADAYMQVCTKNGGTKIVKLVKVK